MLPIDRFQEFLVHWRCMWHTAVYDTSHIKIPKDILHPTDMIAMRMSGNKDVNIADAKAFKVGYDTGSFIRFTCINQDRGTVITE